MNSKDTSTESATGTSLVPKRSPAVVAGVVTLLVAYQLFVTAQQTGNYEGMWFSLAHTVIVAVATVVALRSPC